MLASPEIMPNPQANSDKSGFWYKRLMSGRGNGVKIGLLDTGVQDDHPDVQGTIAAHYEIEGHGEQVTRVRQGFDWISHGTACAGIIHEMAPEAEIHSVQIIGQKPTGTPANLMAGLRFAIDQGWDVINISAGAGRPHKELRIMAEEAWNAGIIVIAAKDNRPGEIGFPAAFPTVLAVDMEHFKDRLTFRYDPACLVQVEAKGVYVDAPCADGGRKLYTGSSFAAPHISAIAARLKSEVPELDAWMFREVLSELTEPVFPAAAAML